MYSNSDDMDDSDDHVIYDEDNDDANNCTRLNSCQTKNINYTTELNNNKDQLEYKSINQNDLVNFSFKNKINNDSYINSKIYRAVNDVTFQINENECLSLLGPNGAGKTTTISMIMGKENITRGEIYFEKNTYSGLCPQYSTLWPSLKVKEILEFYLMIAGYSKKTSKLKARYLMELSKIESYSNYRINELSGGTKRKLSLLISLCNNPRHLFLDMNLLPELIHLLVVSFGI